MTALAVTSLVGATSSAAIAADVSPWDEESRSAARLVGARAQGDGEGRVFRAGVEIRLKEGWKTYWRYPGDSGVPPKFDFSKSRNVKSVEVLYPAPERFPDGAGGHSIGYMGDVMLPLHVTPQDARKPVTLGLNLAYAVCEQLCVPAEADLQLQLSGEAGGQDATIANAEKRVPRRVEIGAPNALSIRAVHRDAQSDKPRVIVDVAAPAGEPVTLFAEGPTEQWALPLPEPVAGAPAGQQRFAFELDGLPPGESVRGALLKLTAVAGDKAIEAGFRLD
jgi:DsbC/DsbD-like thiol-disulfide interchange protein